MTRPLRTASQAAPYLDVESTFLTEEDIVAKLGLVDALLRQTPYGGNEPYTTRVDKAIGHLRRAHEARGETFRPETAEAALCIFANVIYIPTELQNSVWSQHAQRLEEQYDLNRSKFLTNAHLFELDQGGESTEFVRQVGVEGRLDDPTRRVDSVEAFLELLARACDPKGPQDSHAREIVQEVLGRDYWIVLVDNTYSGGSLLSDLRRLDDIISVCQPSEPPKVLVLSQVTTSDTVDSLSQHAVDQPFAHIDIEEDFWKGLYFNQRFKLNSLECQLVKSEQVRAEILQLSEWFAASLLAKDPALDRMRTNTSPGGDNLAWGFKRGGWTIVRPPNTASNSMPLLWYQHSQEGGLDQYEGPFPRVHSRRQAERESRGRALHSQLMTDDEFKASIHRVFGRGTRGDET